MKPRNKFQRVVVEVSKKLPPITQEQIQWGYTHAVEKVAYLSGIKGKLTCSQCGHTWNGNEDARKPSKHRTCPNCHTKLSVRQRNRRPFDDSYYMNIVTTCEDFQVIRWVMIKRTILKVGVPPKLTHSEVMQRWIDKNGKHVTMAKSRVTMGTCYIDAWIFHTPIELRDENCNNKFYVNVYDQIPTGEIYPIQKLIPELKRTGIRKSHYNQRPFDVFTALLKDSRMETLVKAGQISLFKSFLSDRSRKIDEFWVSIRICIRNGYTVKDATLWFDYINYLRFFGKDLHNARYVCPSDLHREHDRYMHKKAKADAQKEIEKLREKEEAFREAKARFFGLTFSDGLIQVRVLESIEEIVLEGKLMHHCVGGYYSKADSLILSACIDGKKIETIELSLSKLQVIQSRGVCNKNTKYHNQIINLVENNIPLIEKRLTA